ncbi:hypothetical protein OSTOST_01807 [Ostertagia ostertagi]
MVSELRQQHGSSDACLLYEQFVVNVQMHCGSMQSILYGQRNSAQTLGQQLSLQQHFITPSKPSNSLSRMREGQHRRSISFRALCGKTHLQRKSLHNKKRH